MAWLLIFLYRTEPKIDVSRLIPIQTWPFCLRIANGKHKYQPDLELAIDMALI